MRKKIISLDHLKNRIVLATYIFRSLPVLYLNQVAIDDSEKERMRLIIIDLIRHGFLKKKESLHGMQYLLITKQGYDYLIKEVLLSEHNPMYKYKPVRSVRQSISEHGYMNFVFIWHFITQHASSITNEIKIYDDTNLNHCKIPFSFAGKRAMLVPDTVILTSSGYGKKAILVENDTGREEYQKIYKKLVEYGAFIQNAEAESAINEIELYLILHSKARMEKMFYSPTGIAQLFNYYNNSEKIKDIPVETILRGFKEGKVTFYLSVFNNTNPQCIYNFQKYNLPDEIIKIKPEWKHLV